jgi:hypothetical protein
VGIHGTRLGRSHVDQIAAATTLVWSPQSNPRAYDETPTSVPRCRSGCRSPWLGCRRSDLRLGSPGLAAVPPALTGAPWESMPCI